MKKLTQEDFIEKSLKIHGDKYLYDDVIYLKNNINVNIFCKECETHFSQIPNDHMRGSGCPNCRKLNTTKFIKRCEELHEYFYNYSKTIFKNCSSKVIITCPKHGDFTIRADGHLTGRGCKKCADEKLKKDTDYFINKSNIIHNNFYTYGKTIYTSANEKVIITCPVHDDFIQIAYNHTNGCGCPVCKISKGEKNIMNLLKSYNINYIYQKTFDNCKGYKNKLPFDFYLPDLNTCIEFDGIQHYESVEYFGGEETLKKTLETDKLKNEYCLNNNIRLIRIKYNENIEDKLSSLI